MKRRTFLLLGVGAAAACGSNKKRGSSRAGGPPKVTPPHAAPNISLMPMVYQGAQSPLLFHAGSLLQATGSELRTLHPLTLARTGVLQVATSNICDLRDGRIAALIKPATPSGMASIALIEPASGRMELFEGRLTGLYGSTLLPAASGEVYLVAGKHISRLALRNHKIVPQTLVELPHRATMGGRTRSEQITALADGRVVYPALFELHVVAPKAHRALPLPSGTPVHIANASEGRVWYTEHRAGGLVLAELATTLRVHMRVPLGGKIISLASGLGVAAAVVCTDVYELTCEIAVVDETSGLQWRIPLPKAVIRRDPGPFIAVSEHRVVVAAAFDPNVLLAWDTPSGKPVVV